MTSPTRAAAALGLAVALTLTGCGGSTVVTDTTDIQTSGTATASATSSPSESASASASAAAFDPASASQLFPPTKSGSATTGKLPLVVLVPGGGWDSHYNGGFVPLANDLAAAGFAVVNTSYRAGQEGVRFPVPVHDVQCSIAYAAKIAAAQGISGGPVIVVGHSAGGHLGALAAVSGDALHPSCADPIPPITGFVGLGGVYDTALFEPYMTYFFGGPRAANLATWESGDPIAYVAAGKAPKRLHVLLIAGEKDFVVPMNQAEGFDAALRKAGVPVTLTVAPGKSHDDLIDPAVAAAPIIAWVRAFSG
jgi:acetyl esterase/lipase